MHLQSSLKHAKITINQLQRVPKMSKKNVNPDVTTVRVYKDTFKVLDDKRKKMAKEMGVTKLTWQDFVKFLHPAV
jgi:hypothetical protein